ncbi:MAG: hypothetical protein VX502_04500 [Candidatus Thermoplasmatota archaeon]|nr:hypothetical protein [Candidatus Thermoplasmatota archaeon]
MERSTRSLLLSVAILALLVPASPLMGQDLDAWDLGIIYPGDDAETPFEISRDGTVRVEFFVENSGFVEIELEFEYEIPFGGEHDAPESATVAAGSNETFDLKVKEIDVFNFEARQEDSFSITATVIARQGVPDPLPLDSQQSEEGDLVIPTIYDLRIDVDDPLGPMNAGTDTILRVSVTNTGNVQDKVGDIEVSDDCPLLTADNGLDELMMGNIMPAKAKEADLKVMASQSHPKRHCDITVTVSSNGAMNSGESVVVSDEVRVSVEPPLTNEKAPDEDDPDDPEEVLSSNLPAPGVLTLLLGFMVALPHHSKRPRD